VLWTAASVRAGGQTDPAPKPDANGERAQELAESIAEPDRITEPLNAILKGSGDLAAFRLRLEWVAGTELTSVTIHGIGVGIWEERSQFRLTRPELLSLVRSLKEAHVGAMQPQYGEDESDRLTFRGKLTVAVGPVAKHVVQLFDGEQSEALGNLAKRILALAERKGSQGISASSLSDGLRKLADGTLAPEAFEIVFQRRDDRPVPAPEEGLLLRLRGRIATARVFRPRSGYGPPRSRVLGKSDFQTLLAALRQNDPTAFESGLFASRYTEVRIRVLNWSKDVQARRYLGVTPETHGRTQEAFDRVCAELDRVARTTFAEGTEEPEID
jgi:hypothetical protein